MTFAHPLSTREPKGQGRPPECEGKRIYLLGHLAIKLTDAHADVSAVTGPCHLNAVLFPDIRDH